jgi:hypothetical protein
LITLLALHFLSPIWLLFFISLQPFRPSLQALFEDYWRLMPEYQQLPGGLQQLEFQRLLFGFFPTYKDSPLAPGFDRCSAGIAEMKRSMSSVQALCAVWVLKRLGLQSFNA